MWAADEAHVRTASEDLEDPALTASVRLSEMRSAWFVGGEAMRGSCLAGRLLAGPLLLGGALIGTTAGSASPSTCVALTGIPAQNPGTSYNSFNGVAVRSSCDAWAVGNDGNGSTTLTLIEHWNGHSWNVKSSPDPGNSVNSFAGVAATSATNAWAVGNYKNGPSSVGQSLIAHWNGASWSKQSSPNPGTYSLSSANAFGGVTATSATNAWAVGTFVNSIGGIRTLIAHWNGSSWSEQSSPNPGGIAHVSQLLGVSATSATNAWAVGAFNNGTASGTLIEHWNGKTWKVAPSPNRRGTSGVLRGVDAVSATNVWAVGYSYNGTGDLTLIEHWNGTAWKIVSSPNPLGPSHDNVLDGVTATSATNAWAVGWYTSGTASGTLIENWNGHAWALVKSPNPGDIGNFLNGVAASTAANLWMVGYYDKNTVSGTVGQTLALHCC